MKLITLFDIAPVRFLPPKEKGQHARSVRTDYHYRLVSIEAQIESADHREFIPIYGYRHDNRRIGPGPQRYLRDGKVYALAPPALTDLGQNDHFDRLIPEKSLMLKDGRSAAVRRLERRASGALWTAKGIFEMTNPNPIRLIMSHKGADVFFFDDHHARDAAHLGFAFYRLRRPQGPLDKLRLSFNQTDSRDASRFLNEAIGLRHTHGYLPRAHYDVPDILTGPLPKFDEAQAVAVSCCLVLATYERWQATPESLDEAARLMRLSDSILFGLQEPQDALREISDFVRTRLRLYLAPENETKVEALLATADFVIRNGHRVQTPPSPDLVEAFEGTAVLGDYQRDSEAIEAALQDFEL